MRGIEILAEGLAVGRSGRACLESVGFRLKPGGSLAVLGPNGAGKSTLLDTLGGLLAPVAGRATLDGVEPCHVPAKKRAALVSFVPQHEPADHGLSSLETALLGRIAHSGRLFETAQDLEAARRALEFVGAEGLADRPFRELSGGERQRILIARAVAQETPAVFADEPTASLDPSYQTMVGRLLSALAAQGRTVVVATHDLTWAGFFMEEALLLAGGRVVAQGPTRQVVNSEILQRAYGSPFRSFPLGSGTVTVPDHAPR